LKDQTQGIVRLFQFDQINNVLLNCAEYQPSEMSPAYQHSRLQGFRFTPNSCNQGLKSIKALIKLQFVEVQSDTDLVLIDNLDAIQLMIHSIRNRDKGNDGLSKTQEIDAIRELNYDLRDKFPIEQFVCSFNPYGTARLERVVGGMIYCQHSHFQI
jgi:hypothetical protein